MRRRIPVPPRILNSIESPPSPPIENNIVIQNNGKRKVKPIAYCSFCGKGLNEKIKLCPECAEMEVRASQTRDKYFPERVKVGQDEYCLECREWMTYDSNGNCIKCGKNIKRIFKHETTTNIDYKIDEEMLEVEEEVTEPEAGGEETSF